MQWENLTSEELGAAVAQTNGVCLLPLGVLEKHGSHLPLGTDAMHVHEICIRAAEMEPAVVFPKYYFGSIHEARHQPGAIALPSTLIFELLSAVCVEIARNGFRKIIIVNGHGGNAGLLEFFKRDMLSRHREYMLYINAGLMDDPIMESTAAYRGHADELEISVMKYVKGDLVKGDGTPGSYGYHHTRLDEFSDAELVTPVDWYGGFPGTLCGDQTPGTAAKGEVVVRRSVERLVKHIQLVKNNDTAQRLYNEYHERAQHPQCRDE